METRSKIKFIKINKQDVDYINVTVNDLTVKNNHSYTVSETQLAVHNCTTAYMTSFGSRNCQASTVLECCRVAKVPIIADGGIEFPGDIAVALTMGATMIMTGALLAGCTDSPGELKFINNEYIKEYWGSASQHESGKANRIEGTMKLIPYKNKTLLEQYKFIQECIQSAISYGGGNSLQVFDYVRWK